MASRRLVLPAALGPVIRLSEGENDRQARLILRKLSISSDSRPVTAVANDESGDDRIVGYGDYKNDYRRMGMTTYRQSVTPGLYINALLLASDNMTSTSSALIAARTSSK